MTDRQRGAGRDPHAITRGEKRQQFLSLSCAPEAVTNTARAVSLAAETFGGRNKVA